MVKYFSFTVAHLYTLPYYISTRVKRSTPEKLFVLDMIKYICTIENSMVTLNVYSVYS